MVTRSSLRYIGAATMLDTRPSASTVRTGPGPEVCATSGEEANKTGSTATATQNNFSFKRKTYPPCCWKSLNGRSFIQRAIVSHFQIKSDQGQMRHGI